MLHKISYNREKKLKLAYFVHLFMIADISEKYAYYLDLSPTLADPSKLQIAGYEGESYLHDLLLDHTLLSNRHVE